MLYDVVFIEGAMDLVYEKTFDRLTEKLKRLNLNRKERWLRDG